MGKLNMGILGGFSGAVGTVVGSSNKKGEDIIRARSRKRRSESSEGQVIQQTKFGITTGFLQGLNPVVRTGLRLVSDAANMSAFNYACRHALKNAVTGTETAPELDYSKIIISDGDLSRIPGATAVKEANSMKFSWSDVLTGPGAITDKVALVVYNVTNGELSYSMGDILRSAKTATLALPYSETGDKLLSYLFFQDAANPFIVSTSQYLGAVTLTE